MMLIGLVSIWAVIVLQRVLRVFSFSSNSDMMGSAKDSDGSGVSERSSSGWIYIARLGGWIGAGRLGVLGKKTELKLVFGDTGVPGARGCWRLRSKGDDFLG